MRRDPSVSPSLFDGQARSYDRRAGLPAGVGHAVARAVCELCRLGPDDLLLEAGAGTGLVGRWLAAEPVRYLGFDLSLDMLAAFCAHSAPAAASPAGPGPWRVRADGNRPWPLRDGAARAIFSSRALHLLSTPHVAGQVARLGHPGGWTLLTGRLRFAPDGLRHAMAVEMRRLLRAEGERPRGGERRQKRLLAALADGAEPIPRREVARWTVSWTPRQGLADWRGKPGLGGIAPPQDVKGRVLEAVERWAVGAAGDLDREIETAVAYTLEGARFAPASTARRTRSR